MVRRVKKIRMGRRPIRSDRAPMTGSQKKLEMPTQKVTARLSTAESFSTRMPKVGVYTVIR